ncbi:hypothetical protein GLOIN_2v1533061 [Rhizophagus irregularis DAOM 181602=DAOM 197198]|nr:hypothetical protein GLOIN_2v1533061 [Rhizophagus irregularis DAOM 181602=DAOM 197198]
MMPEALLKKQMELYDFISDIFTEAEIIFYFTPERNTKKDLCEVLRKYGIDTNDIRKIPPFIPESKNYRKTNYPTLNFEVVGEEASGRVDYAIKKIIDVVNEELKEEAFDDFDYLYEFVTTTTNQYFLLYTPERIYCSKSDYSHRLPSEGILDDDTKLRQGVKEVMGVIVDLLKDRVEVGDSPDSKGARTKKFIKE